MTSIIFKESNSAINQYDFEGYLIVNLDLNNVVSIDKYLNDFVEKHLFQKEFNNIFIPLTFGNSLSEFLGLRLALHMRTTPSINQNKNIFIYGFEYHTNLLDHPFFSVLNIKGVRLIDYSLVEIKKYLTTEQIFLPIEHISQELEKIHLNLPANYYDNHSIANIWGMYRLLEIEGIDKEDISSLKNNDVLNTIYFKWLLAKNRISAEMIKEAKKDTKKYRQEIKKRPKVLYKIDL